MQNAHICRSWLACARRRSGDSLRSAGPCGALSSRASGCISGIELVSALGVAGERGDRHRAVDEDRHDRNPPFFLEPLEPVDQLLDPSDRKRGHDQLARLAPRSP